MGFGISDEVLEKIIIEPWLTCSDRGYSYSTSRNLGLSQFIPPIVPQGCLVVSSSPTPKEEENITFIQNVIALIQKASELVENKSLHSDDIPKMIDNIVCYYKSVAQCLGISYNLHQTWQRNTNAASFLFQGIIEQVFFVITHESIDKVRMRNIVHDAYVLMELWQLNNTVGAKKKQAFFDHIANQFGLDYDKFHCCPHCGSAVYRGINNCPNCFKGVASQKSVCIPGKESECEKKLHYEEQAVCDLREQFAETQTKIVLQKAILDSSNEHAEETDTLRQRIEQLEKQIQEKDIAIQAFRNHISGETTSTSGHVRILVIGEYALCEQDARDLVRITGLQYEMLEFCKEYSKAKTIAARIKNNSKYSAIIVGPIPHKVKNIDGETSLISMLKREGYPFVVEARTYQGELKISRESFQHALSKIAGHLIAKGLLT